MDDRELLQQLQCPVVGSFGAEDERITSWAEQEFKPEMERLGWRLEMKVYSGAPHGFHNPSAARAYRPDAASEAFQRTLGLFEEVLGRTQSAVV
jgi:carboxymethylenebutenolidase